MNLFDIEFPVYPIRTHVNPVIKTKNNITTIEYDASKKIEGDLFNIRKTKILDNKNLKGGMLGIRLGLIPPDSKYNYTNEVAYGFAGLTGMCPRRRIFIDNSGVVFKYIKSTRTKVIYYKIKSRRLVEGKGYKVKVRDNLYNGYISGSILTPGIEYLGLVLYKHCYLLYDLSEEHQPDRAVGI